jgi:hypothetical protein
MRDTIDMAREAGFCHDVNNGIYLSAPMHIKAFEALVRADEREACAKLIESHGATLANGAMLAEAIRARGNT